MEILSYLYNIFTHTYGILSYVYKVFSYIYANLNYLLLLFLCLVIVIILWCIMWCMICWYTLKWFKINILETELCYYNEYTDKEKQLIEEYGELKVSRMYLIQEPLGVTTSLLVSMMSSLKLLRKMDMEHTCIMVELKTKEGEIKRVIIDKGCRLEVKLKYNTNSDQKVKSIKIKKNKYTLNEILENTKLAMSEERFYNYHYYNNNCHDLAVGILKSVNCCSDDIEKRIRKNYHECGKPNKEIFSELGVYLFSFILSLMYRVENLKEIINYISWRIRKILYYKRPPAPKKKELEEEEDK